MFFSSGPELGVLLRRSYVLVIINKTINKMLSKFMFRTTVSAVTVIYTLFNN